MALTDKQEMFCREYLIDLNATQAAIRAGYSVKTANRILVSLTDGLYWVLLVISASVMEWLKVKRVERLRHAFSSSSL